MKLSKKAIWLTWETQRRNQELANAFGAEYVKYDFKQVGRIKRYLVSSFKTLKKIFTNKPEVIFAQCPSFVLCLLLSFVKIFFNFIFVIDAHNNLKNYFLSSNLIVRLCTRYFLNQADYIILTNTYLSKELNLKQKKVLILPDKLPVIKKEAVKPAVFSDTHKNIVFICSFAEDEPVEEFLLAAEKLTHEAKFFITGKKKNAQELVSFASSNIVFTDFLSTKDFDNMISYSDVNIDLTIEDNLLVCGAYESLACEVPCIVSDTKISKEIFQKGFIYTKTDSSSIEESIKYSIDSHASLSSEIKTYKADFVSLWQHYFSECLSKLR